MLASTILRKTAINDGIYEDALAHYLNQGSLNAKMPKGITLRVPARRAAVKPRRVRHAAVRAAAVSFAAVRAAGAVAQAEPVMTSAWTLGVLAPFVTLALSHLGVHWSVGEQSAALTILIALASVYSAIRTRPVRVPVLAGAAATVATASAAFCLHISPAWIGAEMPVLAFVSWLLLRIHASPRIKTTVEDVEAVDEQLAWRCLPRRRPRRLPRASCPSWRVAGRRCHRLRSRLRNPPGPRTRPS